MPADREGNMPNGNVPELRSDDAWYFTIEWTELREIAEWFYANGRHADALKKFIKRVHNRRQAAEHLNGGTWYGYTADDVELWLKNGYRPELLQDVGFNPPIRDKRRLKFDEEGDEFHYDLAASGDDRPFSYQTTRPNIPGAAIEARVSMSAGTRAETVNAYNVWIARAAFSLEDAGVDCEISFRNDVQGSLNDGKKVVTIVRVKKEGMTADFTSWSPMMSPAAFRTFIFLAKIVAADRLSRNVDPGLGRPLSGNEWDLEFEESRRVLLTKCPRMPKDFPALDMTDSLRRNLREMQGKLSD
jgi:hypothetical protein